MGNRPYFRVHLLPAKTSQQGRTPPQLEQTGSKDVTEGHAKGQKPKASGRADTRTDRSSERGTPSIRTEEEPDSGAEGVETPGHPGKKGQGPAPRHLCRMWSSTHPGQHQVRDVRREAQGKQAAVPAEGQAKDCSARNSGLRPDQDFLTTAPAQKLGTSQGPGQTVPHGNQRGRRCAGRSPDPLKLGSLKSASLKAPSSSPQEKDPSPTKNQPAPAKK